MAIDIDHVIKHFRVGNKLIFADRPIAEIMSVKNPLIEIQDVHQKRWLVNQDHLANLSYTDFLSDLASVIAHHCPASAAKGSARHKLMMMKPGDTIQNSDTYLATLIEIAQDDGKGPVLVFRDVNEKRRQIYPRLLSDELSFDGFVTTLQQEINLYQTISDEPILTRYFKNEFIPKMLSQLDYDNLRWGDTWLMRPSRPQEIDFQEHINIYIEYFQHFGKKVPWLKVVGYAIIAQAREDHPEWLF